MENRKKLHDYGLALTIIGILNLFMFGATIVAGLADGSVTEAMAVVEADILGAVKFMLGIIVVLMLLLVAADVLLGVKALKVSKNPNAHKGYIIVAMVFLVMNFISTVSQVKVLMSGSAPDVKVILNTASSVLTVCIYALFIKAATAVRKDVLSEKMQ